MECHKWIELGMKTCLKELLEWLFASRADQRVSRWFRHVERMDRYPMARGVDGGIKWRAGTR